MTIRTSMPFFPTTEPATFSPFSTALQSQAAPPPAEGWLLLLAIVQMARQLGEGWGSMGMSGRPPAPAQPTGTPDIPVGSGPARVDENGAFLPGGDTFSMGGREFSANHVLERYLHLPPEQQTAAINDPVILNALAVRMGRSAWATYVNDRSAGGRLYQGPSGYDAERGLLGYSDAQGQRQTVTVGKLY